MSRSHIKILAAAAAVVAFSTPGFSQLLQDDKRPSLGRSEDAKKNDAAFDAQFRARTNADEHPAKADPWGSVRTPATQQNPAASKKAASPKNN